MEKKQKQILIGVAVLLLLVYLMRNGDTTSYQNLPPEEDGGSGGGGSGGGGGGGGENPTYQPTGDDSSDSQSQDPTSPLLDYKPIGGKPSVPLVGDIASGGSGKPSLGKPSQTNVSYVGSVIGSTSQQKLLRGYPHPTGGGSYFK